MDGKVETDREVAGLPVNAMQKDAPRTATVMALPAIIRVGDGRAEDEGPSSLLLQAGIVLFQLLAPVTWQVTELQGGDIVSPDKLTGHR